MLSRPHSPPPTFHILDSNGEVALCPEKTREGRAARARARLAWRVPENLVILGVCVFTLTHPLVPLFVKTYSAGG